MNHCHHPIVILPVDLRIQNQPCQVPVAHVQSMSPHLQRARAQPKPSTCCTREVESSCLSFRISTFRSRFKVTPVTCDITIQSSGTQALDITGFFSILLQLDNPRFSNLTLKLPDQTSLGPVRRSIASRGRSNASRSRRRRNIAACQVFR